MKKLLLIATILVVGIFKSQDYKKIDEVIKNNVRIGLKEDGDIVNLKFSGIDHKIITLRDLVFLQIDYNKKKIEKYIEILQKKLDYIESLPVSEKQPYFDDIIEFQKVEKKLSEKQNVLLDLMLKADDKKKNIISTKVNFYAKLSDDETDGNFTRNFFFKPNGDEIKDVYEYIIMNQ